MSLYDSGEFKQKTRPNTGRELNSRGSTRFVERDIISLYISSASNGAIRSTYSLTALGFPLAGGFHWVFLVKALNFQLGLSVRKWTNYSSRSMRFYERYYMPLSENVK